MPVPPTITLSSCIRAASAAELRYRIDAQIRPSRGVRVLALDEQATAVVAGAAEQDWATARFFECTGHAAQLQLRGIGGGLADLVEQLESADVVVMVATNDTGAGYAHAIGKACWERGIMTAGVAVSSDQQAAVAVAALRPHARVLLPAAQEHDVTDLLAALRA